MRIFGQLRAHWLAVGIALVAVAVVSAQVVLVRAHPIGQGSVFSSVGLGTACPGFEPTATTVRCNTVTFAPGAPVALGFSVRNNGPLPLTIVSVRGLGSESKATLAELAPVLPPAGGPGDVTFALDRTGPFRPIDLAPGQDAPIEFLGRMRGCEALRGYWPPGSGVRFDRALVTIRILAMSTETEVPLQQALQIDAPAEGVCPK